MATYHNPDAPVIGVEGARPVGHTTAAPTATTVPTTTTTTKTAPVGTTTDVPVHGRDNNEHVYGKSGKSVTWAAYALAWVSWIVALAGLSAVQHRCSDSGVVGSSLTGLWSNFANYPQLMCSKLFRWDWWCLWLEAAVLVLVGSSILALKNRRLGRPESIGFLAVATVLTMWACNDFLNIKDVASLAIGLSGGFKTAAATAFAGFLMLSFFNFILLHFVGLY